MTTQQSTASTDLLHALKLARLEPSERFTKENITAIHKGIAPHYELLTGYELPTVVVIVGFGLSGTRLHEELLFLVCDDFFPAYSGDNQQRLYGTHLSTAIERGWVDANDPMFRKPFEWVTDREPRGYEANVGGFVLVPKPIGVFSRERYEYRHWTIVAHTRQPWARIEDARNATQEELANIPEEFKWKEGK